MADARFFFGEYHTPMRWLRLSYIDLLRYAGLLTYACVGLPLLIETFSGALTGNFVDHFGWVASYALFGGCYWAITHRLGQVTHSVRQWALLLLLGASAIANSYFSRSALAGILLLVLSGVLPWVLTWRYAIVWTVAQYGLLVPIFATRIDGFTWLDGILQSTLYLGFTSFTLVTSLVAKGQAEAREEQRQLNAELRATRVLLAESARANERLRIARELHDLLGHHLTALTLNLEVAAHLVEGQALGHVRQAQSLAKLLLGDVREVVSQFREEESIDIRKALGVLLEGLPHPAIAIAFSDDFQIEDSRYAHVLLRCAQESITNCIRHADAQHLRLSFGVQDGNIVFEAADDGRGGDATNMGSGLKGMRERLRKLGGDLTLQSGKNEGFRLRAVLPKEVDV